MEETVLNAEKRFEEMEQALVAVKKRYYNKFDILNKWH